MVGEQAGEKTAHKPLPTGRRWWGRILLLVILCSLAGVTFEAFRQRAREEAIRQGILDRGGGLNYEQSGFSKFLDGIIPTRRFELRKNTGPPRFVAIVNPTVEELEHIGGFPSIKNLRLYGTISLEELLRTLHKLPTLSSLTLSGFQMTDAQLGEIVEALPHPERLSYLSFRQTSLTDEGLRALSRCTSLTRLLVDGSKIEGSGLKHLPTPSMQFLILKHSRVSDTSLRTIVERWGESLIWINLDGNPISDIGLQSLHTVRKLSYLGIGGTEVTPQGVKELMTVRKITRLWIKDLPWKTADLKGVPTDPEFQDLDLSGWAIGDEDLKSLPELPELKALSLERTLITDEGIDELKRYPKLVLVRLDGTRLSEKGLEKLAQSPEFLSLSIGKTGVSFEDVMRQETLGKIRTLTMDGMNLTDEQLRELARRHPKCTFQADDRVFRD